MLEGHWILYGKEPVPVNDLMEWAEWFEDHTKRIVKQESIWGIRISTVVLSLDHNFGNDGPPLLFETMIFGGVYDQLQTRYSTWEEAEKGHKEAVKLVKKTLIRSVFYEAYRRGRNKLDKYFKYFKWGNRKTATRSSKDMPIP